MKLESVLNSRVGGYVALGAMGVGLAYFVVKKIPTAKDAINAVSPFNNDNVFSNGVDLLGKGLTGKDNWSLGGSIYDWSHTEYSPDVKGSGGVDWENMALTVNPVAWATDRLAQTFKETDLPDLNFDYVNPASDKNIINQGVEKLGQVVSGNDSWTLGGWLYDVFNPGK